MCFILHSLDAFAPLAFALWRRSIDTLACTTKYVDRQDSKVRDAAGTPKGRRTSEDTSVYSTLDKTTAKKVREEEERERERGKTAPKIGSYVTIYRSM